MISKPTRSGHKSQSTRRGVGDKPSDGQGLELTDQRKFNNIFRQSVERCGRFD